MSVSMHVHHLRRSPRGLLHGGTLGDLVMVPGPQVIGSD
jgi:hypothetical protein